MHAGFHTEFFAGGGGGGGVEGGGGEVQGSIFLACHAHF